jgi:hypothetical protein
MRMRVAVLCFLCATAACGPPLDLGFGVAVTATFDSTVSDAQLAQVSQLIIAGSGDETYEIDRTLGRAADRTERFVYRPLAETRRLALKLTAENADGESVAVGMSSELQLDAGETTRLEITLLPAMIPDSGSSDGSSGDGGTSTCAHSSFAICEDFENGLGPDWATEATNAVVTIDHTHAHSGSNALHVHLDALNSGTSTVGAIAETVTLATPVVGFHARAFVFLPTASIAGSMSLIEAQQLEPPKQALKLLVTDGALALYDSFGLTTGLQKTLTPVPIGSWACVEWIVQIGAPGSVSVSFQGTPVPGGEIDDTTASTPPVAALQFGGAYSNTSSAVMPVFDFWMDDLVVDPGAIGCN